MMGFTSVLSLASLALTNSVDVHPHQPHVEAFAKFQQRYGRSYEKGSEEYEHRLSLFSKRVEEADAHNANPARLWSAGAGPLADHTEEELASLRGWFGAAKGGMAKRGNLRKAVMLAQTGAAVPEEFNWTSLATLSTAREQGGCGSCWAVASATVLTAHAEIYQSNQRSFSTEELVHCVENPQKCGGSGGCQGATVELAMDYAINHAMKTAEELKYTGRDGKCPGNKPALAEVALKPANVDTVDVASVGLHSASTGSGSMMTHWERLPENKYEPLLQAVYEHGPTAISVDAGSWSSYSSGIFNSCSKDAVINHAVVLIGFGKSDKHKYWLVENSWGPDWGENGRIRLLRQDEEESHCGIDHQPQDGTGCEGGPAQVQVCGMCGILYDNVVPHYIRK